MTSRAIVTVPQRNGLRSRIRRGRPGGVVGPVARRSSGVDAGRWCRMRLAASWGTTFLSASVRPDRWCFGLTEAVWTSIVSSTWSPPWSVSPRSDAAGSRATATQLRLGRLCRGGWRPGRAYRLAPDASAILGLQTRGSRPTRSALGGVGELTGRAPEAGLPVVDDFIAAADALAALHWHEMRAAQLRLRSDRLVGGRSDICQVTE